MLAPSSKCFGAFGLALFTCFVYLVSSLALFIGFTASVAYVPSSPLISASLFCFLGSRFSYLGYSFVCSCLWSSVCLRIACSLVWFSACCAVCSCRRAGILGRVLMSSLCSVFFFLSLSLPLSLSLCLSCLFAVTRFRSAS